MSAMPTTTSRRRFCTLFSLWFAMLLGTATLVAQDNPAVDSIFAEWDKPDSPGCALGVVSNGDLVYARGYGMADLDAGRAITPSTVFYLASVSKQFTASTMALLAESGAISLDDEIRSYFSELPQHANDVTIRHMIHHTSGLRDYLTLMAMAGMSYDESYEPAQLLQLVARQEGLNFPPGSEYLYSNTGYFLMPLIVERVTGQSVREFSHQKIFGPLDMDNTHFHDDYRHEVAERAYSYGKTDSGFESTFLEKFDQVGSGGVLSTVEDLVKWDANFYDPLVGGQSFLDLMHTRGVLTNGDTLPHAFGLRLGEYKGQKTVEHGGSMMGFKTHLVRFPDRRFSVICLCNLGDIDPGSLAYDVADVYLEATFAEYLGGLVGDYYARELDATWSVILEGPDLLLSSDEDQRQVMLPVARDTFRYRSSNTAEFFRSATGAVSGFTVDAGRVRGVEFQRR